MPADYINDIHFGGPDLAPGRLRDLLAERVAAVPPGGTIDWVTYYFRDRRLAAELLRARQRGVKVTVTLEGRPRTAHANDAVVAMLSGADGLGDGFRTVCLPGVPAGDGKQWKPHLHEKLYCFSHPQPVHNKFVLVERNGQRWVVFGSFNWTTRSYWLNHEIGAISTNRQLLDAFAERWEAMSNQAK